MASLDHGHLPTVLSTVATKSFWDKAAVAVAARSFLRSLHGGIL